MPIEIILLLNRYCVARKLGDRVTQLEIADQLVDRYIPQLIQNGTDNESRD